MLNPPEGRRGPSPSLIIAGILIAAVAVIVLLASLTVFQLPSPVTTQGDKINHLYWGTLTIAMIVYFLVTAKNGTEEGTYGKALPAAEIPISSSACRAAQNLNTCP